MKPELKLISMEEIPIEKVRWLWRPYIPLGKLTLVQGDPGEGKTTFTLALIAALTRGEALPGNTVSEPMNVIYQTAEDGLADTIKPRLVASGADCSRVLVIDEDEKALSFCDARLEEAVRQTGARLVVLDPIQAYIGEGVDMHRANEVRPLLKRLGDMAQRTMCAVVLIGHVNKQQGTKSAYRNLGTIDFPAAARSVLVVGGTKDEQDLRAVAQDKNSLARKGPSLLFEIREGGGVVWKGTCELSADEVLNGSAASRSKVEIMADELKKLLVQELPASYIFAYAKNIGIGERTVKEAKERLCVFTRKKGDKWYWALA